MPVLTERKIDCHCHVIDPVQFPYQAGTPYRPSGQEIAPYDHLLRIMALHGIEHALIVGTNSGYAHDSSIVLDALARGEGRFKGVAVVQNDITAADLRRLKSLGMAGVAFNAPFNDPAAYAQTGELLGKLEDLDMMLQLQVKGDQLLQFMPLVEASGVRLVVDHCGRPAPEGGLDQPGFQALLALGQAGRASVKLSGFSQFSRQRYPYADTHGFVAALLAAFTPGRCMWGSDWPFLRATERIDYGPLLLLADTLIPAEADRQRVLWDTPCRLFGFGKLPPVRAA